MSRGPISLTRSMDIFDDGLTETHLPRTTHGDLGTLLSGVRNANLLGDLVASLVGNIGAMLLRNEMALTSRNGDTFLLGHHDASLLGLVVALFHLVACLSGNIGASFEDLFVAVFTRNGVASGARNDGAFGAGLNNMDGSRDVGSLDVLGFLGLLGQKMSDFLGQFLLLLGQLLEDVIDGSLGLVVFQLQESVLQFGEFRILLAGFNVDGSGLVDGNGFPVNRSFIHFNGSFVNLNGSFMINGFMDDDRNGDLSADLLVPSFAFLLVNGGADAFGHGFAGTFNHGGTDVLPDADLVPDDVAGGKMDRLAFVHESETAFFDVFVVTFTVHSHLAILDVICPTLLVIHGATLFFPDFIVDDIAIGHGRNGGRHQDGRQIGKEPAEKPGILLLIFGLFPM